MKKYKYKHTIVLSNGHPITLNTDEKELMVGSCGSNTDYIAIEDKGTHITIPITSVLLIERKEL